MVAIPCFIALGVSEPVRVLGVLPVDAGRLDDACFLERLIAVESELGQCYGLDFRVTFELLGAESDAARPS